MERNAITELEQLTINNKSRNYLKEIAKWSFFLSIVGFIGIGIMILMGVFSNLLYGSTFAALSQQQAMPFDMTSFMTALYIIMALIYFFPVLYLYKFSRKMKTALSTKNDDTLADALEMLKSHYKFLGVFMIIILSLYALIFILAMVGVALA